LRQNTFFKEKGPESLLRHEYVDGGCCKKGRGIVADLNPNKPGKKPFIWGGKVDENGDRG